MSNQQRVYCGNLRPGTTRQDLQRLFSPLSPVSYFINDKGFAFIEFRDHADVEEALKRSGETIHGRPVDIQRPKSKGASDRPRSKNWRSEPSSQRGRHVSWRGARGARGAQAPFPRARAHGHKQLSIGIYFGTFDPVHENHIAMAISALSSKTGSKAEVSHVVFVPNPDNPFKPFVSNLDQRLELLDARLRDLGDSRLHLHDARGVKMDWNGRSRTCSDIRRKFFADGVRVNVVQLLGQDSFEEPSAQKALTSPNVLQGLNRELLIFPRNGVDPKPIAPQLTGRVRWAASHADPVPGLSSTKLRELIIQGNDIESTALHPIVYAKIKELGMYPAPVTSTVGAVVAINGPPGSGKSSLGRTLADLYGATHVSMGDFYRIAKEEGSAAFVAMDSLQATNKLEWTKWLTSFAHGCLLKVFKQSGNNRFIVDGVRPSAYKNLHEGLGGSIDMHIDLSCPDEILLQRLKLRNRPNENPGNRVNSYHKRQFLEDKVLASFQKSHADIVSFMTIDVSAPIDKYLHESGLATKLGELWHAKKAAPMAAREIDLSEITKATAIEVETSSADHYNARGDNFRSGSQIDQLRNYNNFAKDALISFAVNTAASTDPSDGSSDITTVFDLGCGKGGDLPKLMNQTKRIQYIGADVASVSVEHAKQRFERSQRDQQTKNIASAHFVAHDCFMPDLWDTIDGAVGHQVQCHAVSSQFVIHYAFGVQERAVQLLENVASRLKPGGVFVATCPDADILLKHLEDATKCSFGNDLYQVEFDLDFTEASKLYNEQGYGVRYLFSLQSAVDRCPEYLVKPALLTELADQVGLDLVSHTSVANLHTEDLPGVEWLQTKHAKQRRKGSKKFGGMILDPAQKEAVSLYTAFVFRKRPSTL